MSWSRNFASATRALTRRCLAQTQRYPEQQRSYLRTYCTQGAGSGLSSTSEPIATPSSTGGTISTDELAHGIISSERPDYQTHVQPVYTMPFFGCDEETIESIPEDQVETYLQAYGGLIRKRDCLADFRERLRKLTRERLMIHGVVVSDKMNKSVVVAARRQRYEAKLKKVYYVTRRFMAHDEFDLCREGDIVTIRSCRRLSKHKSHVVVRNYGDRTRIGDDSRGEELEKAVLSRI